MNCEMKNHRGPLCILHIATSAQYYCKICHCTTQIGRSDTSSHCQPGFKARHNLVRYAVLDNIQAAGTKSVA